MTPTRKINNRKVTKQSLNQWANVFSIDLFEVYKDVEVHGPTFTWAKFPEKASHLAAVQLATAFTQGAPTAEERAYVKQKALTILTTLVARQIN